MRVKNMKSRKTGKAIPNQFVITDNEGTEYFQSYEAVIVRIDRTGIYLDKNKWDYSKTTSKYRNQFLGETTVEAKKKIESGEYILTELN